MWCGGIGTAAPAPAGRPGGAGGTDRPLYPLCLRGGGPDPARLSPGVGGGGGGCVLGRVAGAEKAPAGQAEGLAVRDRPKPGAEPSAEQEGDCALGGGHPRFERGRTPAGAGGPGGGRSGADGAVHIGAGGPGAVCPPVLLRTDGGPGGGGDGDEPVYRQKQAAERPGTAEGSIEKGGI